MNSGVRIVGAGPVGAVCALALCQQGIAVQVLEAQPEAARADGRTLALSYGSQLILERLGVWRRLQDVTPITRIHISQRGALGVTRLTAEEVDVTALGYVLPYATLTAALKQALAEAEIAVEYGVAVTGIESDAAAATLHTDDGRRLAAPLVVVADGGRGDAASKVRAAPAPKLQRDYEQLAVVCEVQTELPHDNQAYERFTPQGPAALLPKGDRYALVWTASHADAERIAALDDAAFLAELYRHFGGRQGLFLSASPRKTFPLKLAYVGSTAADRVVRIGNAAQTLHPVSGQGFNIGLRDAWELASLCGDASPDALGNAAMLAAYARGRRVDVLGGVGFTDFLVRVFSNDIAPVRHARGLGLLALELCPPLKNFVARRMIFGARG
ncbi:MAG TPA: FAD-dependent monooxygenase [Thiobacillus sp.]|nr:MAG: 2-polyprenyl-6-methoxyphenol hydroxylase [Hydrogenophilales bacterium 28-61-11]OYZ58353.1 MAG: 2-polyprenyl-6-methoxyphenol hydroxylase [Hydrogenophilales bacterium 16-61-112]OZA47406.1 MAG: 2-polyprenyl-6-methoxyphenol hydroxylase [Hydrogenophilales bacterium 17-61-76]HQT30574.1 FAD-dependent monooxygenase [Thiobacillus sp.]HQT69948.1 FAD-dependent monooxygenase [Thiobacillus sp.]